MNMYRNPTAGPSEGRTAPLKDQRVSAAPGHRIGRPAALLMAACVAFAALPGPATAMQVLEATDHAELEAAVSATGVSRVALADDRIRRVIRSPGGFDVEHDATSGDLYLRPLDVLDLALDSLSGTPLPVTLFLGTEQGFTYRLTLTPDERPSAQVLIRNAEAIDGSAVQTAAGAARDARVAELVRLVRAAVRREILPDTIIESDPSRRQVIETWRGDRFVAHVLPAGPGTDAVALAERFGTGTAAVWVADRQGSSNRQRIAVVVTEPGRAGRAR